jgi:hypothetical protein
LRGKAEWPAKREAGLSIGLSGMSIRMHARGDLISRGSLQHMRQRTAHTRLDIPNGLVTFGK